MELEYTKEDFRVKLREDGRWIRRGVLVLFNRQTSSEQAVGRTHVRNGRGFTAFDAPLMTRVAKAFQAKQQVSRDDWIQLKKRMPKYAGQLFRIAQMKARNSGA